MDRELRIKHDRVVRHMEAHGLGGVLLSRRCNFSWYTCGRARNYVSTATDVGNSTLLVTPDKAYVIANNVEAPRLRQEELGALGLEVVEYPYHELDAPGRLIGQLAPSLRLGADAPLAGVEAHKLAGDFDRLRWTLTENEIERYRNLCNDTVEAVEFVCRDAAAGVSEHELAGMLAGALMCTGCTPWVLLVAADERLDKFRHPLPTDLQVKRRFMLCANAERGGLLCACSRVVCLEPISPELHRRHLAVATVEAAMIAATRAGAPLGGVFAEAQRAYMETGFANEWRMHHQGGLIGYLPREIKAAAGDMTEIQENQAYAWNPTIAGTKCEDTVICRGDCSQVLADATDWPTVEVTCQGRAYQRPAILIRG